MENHRAFLKYFGQCVWTVGSEILSSLQICWLVNTQVRVENLSVWQNVTSHLRTYVQVAMPLESSFDPFGAPYA